MLCAIYKVCFCENMQYIGSCLPCDQHWMLYLTHLFIKAIGVSVSESGASITDHPSRLSCPLLLACPAQPSAGSPVSNATPSTGVLHVWGNCCLVMWAAAAAVKCDDSRRILGAASCSWLDASQPSRDHQPRDEPMEGHTVQLQPGNREEWKGSAEYQYCDHAFFKCY